MSDRRTEQREQARAQFRTAGLWGVMNSLKRESDSQRATIATAAGVDTKDLPGFGAEIPFGNTYVSQTSTGSSLGKVALGAILALATGALGLGAMSLLKTPEAPLPIDVEVEWSTPDDQESTTAGRIDGVLIEEHSVFGGTS